MSTGTETALAPIQQQMTPSYEREAFELLQRKARCYSSSDLVPDCYRGDKGLPNCIIALEMANRLGASALMVMQNLYIVKGRPSWSAQFIIAAVNASGRFKPLRFHLEGEPKNRLCIAWTTPSYVELAAHVSTLDQARQEGVPILEGPAVTMQMAQAEGWSGKAGSKWITMPEIMIRYRAATFFGRIYAPDLLMGLRTADELADIEANQTMQRPAPSRVGMPLQIETPAAVESVNGQRRNGAEPRPQSGVAAFDAAVPAPPLPSADDRLRKYWAEVRAGGASREYLAAARRDIATTDIAEEDRRDLLEEIDERLAIMDEGTSSTR
jgi:hypothetical protein